MITIDARWLKTSGIGTYLRNTLPGVIEAFPEKEFCLLGTESVLATLEGASRNNVRLVEVNAPMYSLAEQLELKRKIPKETSLFWATHYNIPLLYRGRMMVTVYDLFHLAMPKLVGGLHKGLYAKVMFNAVRRKASAIITISHFTKKELVRFVGEGLQEIHPIHLGVDESWFNIQRANNPYGKPYLLYVGNVKPHKNLSTLIRAYGSLVDKIPHDLVIIGEKEGFITGDKIVASEAAKLGNRVHFTGYLEDKLMRQYFAHADVFVFPSLYEGFGLPPLEAIAAGCPVIVSEAASLPEVCGDAVLYCNPYKYEDIAKKIMEILNNESLRNELRNKGIAHAHKFTWEKCCIETCNVISSLVANDIDQM